MKGEQIIASVTRIAAEDLRNYQNRFVTIGASDEKLYIPNAAIEGELGVLLDKPNTGQEGKVALYPSIVQLVGNGTLTVGMILTHEYVSATDAGKGKDATGFYDQALAKVLEGSASEDYKALVQLLPPNPTKGTISVPLAITANSTAYFGFFAGVSEKIRITRMSISAKQVPADADGVCTLAATKYDVSGTADKNLLGAATFDLEGIAAAKTSEDLTLTSTAADLIVDTTDCCWFTVVNDSAALTTADQALVVTVYYEHLGA